MDHEFSIEVDHLSFSYDKSKNIISDINFRLKKGEIFVILGSNGAGKTTLLNCVSNMLKPDSGTIRIKGKEITEYSVGNLATVVGYVPQITVPAFSYTCRDYIVMGRAPHMSLMRVPGRAEYAVADAVMEQMNITYLADKSYGNISGGERQQVQIARVLAQEPEIVILDEPANHLDYGNQLKIMQIIYDLANKKGLTVILTSHNPDHSIILDGTVGILDKDGHLTVGNAADTVTEDSLKQLYDTDLHLVYIEKVNRMACVSGSLRRQ